jgi:hypothetical protein
MVKKLSSRAALKFEKRSHVWADCLAVHRICLPEGSSKSAINQDYMYAMYLVPPIFPFGMTFCLHLTIVTEVRSERSCIYPRTWATPLSIVISYNACMKVKSQGT